MRLEIKVNLKYLLNTLFMFSKDVANVYITVLVVDCGDPGMPAYAERKGSNTTYLSKFKYFCNPGYLITGSTERVCQANGTWSGTYPTCSSRFIYTSHSSS